ncbi:MAG: hypothetical protein PVF28_07970 [Thioalkalispiraceae bacterium]|jgi:hypothetical protein
MDVIKKMNPGDPGTKRLQAKYGDQLVCVRYRHDKKNHRRMTTIELVIDEGFYLPERDAGKLLDFKNDNRNVQIRVDYREAELRKIIKAAGGKWDPEHKRWILRYREAERLQLQTRIEEIENI